MSEQVRQFFSEWTPFLAERSWLQALLILAVALVAAKGVDWTLSRAVTVWSRKTDTHLDDRLLALVHRPIFLSVFLAGIWLAANRLDLPPDIATLVLRVLKTIALILWTLFAVRAAAVLLEALSRLEGRASFVEPRTLALLDNTAKILLIGGAAYVLCLAWDIDVGGWLVSAGILGDSLANLFAGLFILADAPYKLGDFINLDSGERGQVTQIGLRSTRLLTRDDVEITVPNSVIANAKIINETGGPWEKERLRVKVGVAYGSDLDQVRSVLLDIAQSHPLVQEEPEPRVRLRGLGDSALEFELLGWIDEPVLRGRVLDSLYEQVYKRFLAEGIEIPFPQRELHLRQPAAGGD
jgi:small-conductance mechanosensitive channel